MNQTQNLVEHIWDHSIIPTLCKYIEIPCKSPAFDHAWKQNGYIVQAMDLISTWCNNQNIHNMRLNIHTIPDRTPILVIEIPGQSDQTVLLYGHMDKQPEMVGWDQGLGPWTPVIKDNRLYGRGAADDGYAIFSSLTAIKVLQEQNIPHPRCVILIEACEESGSYDLPHFMSMLKEQLGEPTLVIGLDSGMGNYDQFWTTTSLRGLVSGVLTVEILREGVHSGAASGIVPSSFRLLRKLLSRIEDENTGDILLHALHVDIPEIRKVEAEKVAEILGEHVWSNYPWVAGARPLEVTGEQLVLNRTWQPALAITGMDNIPKLVDAGNVLRPKTSAMLSMRIPPTCNAEHAALSLKKVLEENPPHHANVSFEIEKTSSGWNAPTMKSWLLNTLDNASKNYFGRPCLNWGEGGSIPFIDMLGKKFPNAQFVITGVLGPHSNAHGPNEFLDIPTAKKVTCCVADILHAVYLQSL